MKKIAFVILLWALYAKTLLSADFYPLFPYYDPQQPIYYYQMADTCNFNLFIAQDTLWRYGKDSVKYNMPFLAAADTHNVRILMADNIYAWKYSTYSGTGSGAASNGPCEIFIFQAESTSLFTYKTGSPGSGCRQADTTSYFIIKTLS